MSRELSQDEVPGKLKEGNNRFAAGKNTFPHLDSRRRQATAEEDQADHAYATVLCCSDSRVPPELIFDVGLMDLFVVRVAGNTVGPNELASVEYGLSHVGTPALVVLGHSDCGAIKEALQVKPSEEEEEDKVGEDNIEQFLRQFKIVCHKARKQHKKSPDTDLIELAAKENIWHGVYRLFVNSYIVRNMFRHGRVRILPAYHDLKTGKVEWMSERKVLDIFMTLGKPLVQTGKIVSALKGASGIPQNMTKLRDK